MDKKKVVLTRNREQMEGILEELCKEFNLPMYALEAVVISPYKFIFSKMREQKFYNFSIPYIGKLYIPEQKRRHLRVNWEEIRKNYKIQKEEKMKKYKEEKYGKAEGNS